MNFQEKWEVVKQVKHLLGGKRAHGNRHIQTDSETESYADFSLATSSSGELLGSSQYFWREKAVVPSLLEGRIISSGLSPNSELKQMEDAFLRAEDPVIHSNRTPRPRCQEEKLLNTTLKEGVSESESDSVVSDSATPWTIQSMAFSRPEYWNGSPSLLQEIFPTQGLNPGLSHCRQTLYREPPGNNSW